MSKNKEKAHDGYIRMYEGVKYLLHSTYELTCAAHETNISKMKEIVEIFSSEKKGYTFHKPIHAKYIDSCHKDPEKRTLYPEQRTIR